jgi:hypothetical protein
MTNFTYISPRIAKALCTQFENLVSRGLYSETMADGAMLKHDIDRRKILGIPRRMTSPARTIMDCFRYQNKLGIYVAPEALLEALRSGSAIVREITRAAVACRKRTVLKTDLDDDGAMSPPPAREGSRIQDSRLPVSSLPAACPSRRTVLLRVWA